MNSSECYTCILLNSLTATRVSADDISRNPVLISHIVLICYILIVSGLMLFGLWFTCGTFDVVLKLYFMLGIVDFLLGISGAIGYIAPFASKIKELDLETCTILDNIHIPLFRSLYLMETFLLFYMILVRYFKIMFAMGSCMDVFINTNKFVFLVVVCVFLPCVPFVLYRVPKQQNGTMTEKDVALFDAVFITTQTFCIAGSIVVNCFLLKILHEKCKGGKQNITRNTNRHQRAAVTLALMVLVMFVCSLPLFCLQMLIVSKLKNEHYAEAHNMMIKHLGPVNIFSLLGVGMNSNVYIIRSMKIRKFYFNLIKKVAPF